MPALSTKTKHYYRERIRSVLVQVPQISNEGIRQRLQRDGLTLDRHYIGKLVGEIHTERSKRADAWTEEEAIVKPEDIHYYDTKPTGVAAMKGHGIDLAISPKESADYTTIVTGEVYYVDGAPKIFIRPNQYNEHVLFPNFLLIMGSFSRYSPARDLRRVGHCSAHCRQLSGSFATRRPVSHSASCNLHLGDRASRASFASYIRTCLMDRCNPSLFRNNKDFLDNDLDRLLSNPLGKSLRITSHAHRGTTAFEANPHQHHCALHLRTCHRLDGWSVHLPRH